MQLFVFAVESGLCAPFLFVASGVDVHDDARLKPSDPASSSVLMETWCRIL